MVTSQNISHYNSFLHLLADAYDATVTRMGRSAAQSCADAAQMYTRAGHPAAPILSAFIQVIEDHHQEWYPTNS